MNPRLPEPWNKRDDPRALAALQDMGVNARQVVYTRTMSGAFVAFVFGTLLLRSATFFGFIM